MFSLLLQRSGHSFAALCYNCRSHSLHSYCRGLSVFYQSDCETTKQTISITAIQFLTSREESCTRNLSVRLRYMADYSLNPSFVSCVNKFQSHCSATRSIAVPFMSMLYNCLYLVPLHHAYSAISLYNHSAIFPSEALIAHIDTYRITQVD